MNDKGIPGYLTLAEAEDRYGVKADTLKKHCQNGKIKGAIRQGKTWFVPNVPDIDPKKPISENYPNLNFDAAYDSNISLYEVEDKARFFFYKTSNTYIYIWEYGYYFVSLFITHSRLHKTYMPLVAQITEAHSALRGSFLLNLNGYHPEAITLLRKAHESIVKALAIRIKPKKAKLVFSAGTQSAESILGVNFQTIWKLGSSFAHGNLIKIFEAWKGIQDKNDQLGVAYGPQLNKSQFGIAANISIFWLYLLIKSLPYLFPKQFDLKWLSKQEHSEKLLKDYLTSVKALRNEIGNVDLLIDKIKKLPN